MKDIKTIIKMNNNDRKCQARCYIKVFLRNEPYKGEMPSCYQSH